MHGSFAEVRLLTELSPNERIAGYLEIARGLIDTEDKWCQGEYTKEDRRCAVQAIREAVHEDYELMLDCVRAISGVEEEPESKVCDINDRNSHSYVMAMFDGTIARLRELSVLRSSF